jgi:hypothetical protein
MNKTVLIFLLLATLSACGPIKESFVDVCTGEKIAGYDKTCKWRIRKTQRREVTAEAIQEQKKPVGVSVFYLAGKGVADQPVDSRFWK